MLWWMACGSGVEVDSGETDTEVVDTDGVDTDSVDTDVVVLNGTVPAESIDAPEFAAVNRDGSSRSRVDLIGHPTVVWFYPAAGTGG